MGYMSGLGAVVPDSSADFCKKDGGHVTKNPDGSFKYCSYPIGTEFQVFGTLKKVDDQTVQDSKGNNWMKNPDGSWDFVSYTGNIISYSAAAPKGGDEVLAGSVKSSGSKSSGKTSASNSSCPEKPRRTSLGERGAAVVCWQKFLISKGFSVGSTGADGDHGKATETASVAYEASLKTGSSSKAIESPSVPSVKGASIIKGIPNPAVYVGGFALATIAVALLARSAAEG